MLGIFSLECCCWEHSWPASIWPVLSLQTVYKWAPTQFRCLILRRKLRHGAAKSRSDLLCCSHSLQIKWKMRGNTGAVILNMMTKFFPAHLVSLFLKKKTLFVGTFSSIHGDSRLSGCISCLPEETSVDFVPCLKAFAVCGFLTCQSAILRGLGESYWLGDGPPWIYAEHTPKKKMQSVLGTKSWQRGQRSHLLQFRFRTSIQGTD